MAPGAVEHLHTAELTTTRGQTKLLRGAPDQTVSALSAATKAGQEWSGNSLAMKFCWCPPGDFKMGDAPNQVDVKLTRGIWMGKCEVTQAEYRSVMKKDPSHFSAAGPGKDAVAGLNTDKFPVEMVSWDNATEF